MLASFLCSGGAELESLFSQAALAHCKASDFEVKAIHNISISKFSIKDTRIGLVLEHILRDTKIHLADEDTWLVSTCELDVQAFTTASAA